MKKTIAILAILLACATALAQDFSGGVKGRVVSRQGRVAIEDARLSLSRDGKIIMTESSAADGSFLIDDLDDGVYQLSVVADGFEPVNVNVTVEKGFIKDLIFVSMTPAQMLQDVDMSNFAEFDMDDSGYSDAPTILFGTNDPYNSIVGYDFTNIRFNNRGYNSETQDVYLSGVKLNDAITGYSPYSLWTGLNEAMRLKESTNGLEVSNYGFGGYNGTTNILANPANVRKGLRASVLTNSAMYRLRLMLTYGSGVRDDGWSYAVNVSARVGGNDWIQGVYYRSFAYYLGAEKKIDDANTIALIHFATPGQRGAQNASTQEVYDLMGDNMYNSNWGYQNGVIRNSRVRKTFEPVTIAKYTYSPSSAFEATTTFLWRTGFNGYTALDWYDAADPRPDYYRNLPSFAYMADDDYNRNNAEKAEWLAEAWTNRGSDFNNYQHVNWDHMYNVNYNSADGRSKYAQEERHVDQNDFNLAQTIKWQPSENTMINGGVNLRANRTENYKKMADLLGGSYFLNVDSFAERDFAISEAKIQNDLDYYLAHGAAEQVAKGGKYGYDYLAQIRRASVWANGMWTNGSLIANVAGTAGLDAFWRDGLVRKGLFAGLDDNGNEIIVNGVNLTSYDAKGNVITSKGKSEVQKYFTYSAKAGLEYIIGSGHRFYGNVGYFNDAPTFNESFISPRTRNTVMDNLTTKKTFSADLNYQLSSHGYNLRVTGFYTDIRDHSDVMSFYDDSQNSFTNFAMTGINSRHTGIELGFKVPTPIQGFTIGGALSWGEYIYTSTPHMVQTIDNSAEIIRDEDVIYWEKTPIYKVAGNNSDGSPIYDQDAKGNYIVEDYKKHYVPSSPQFASELSLKYNVNYWYLEFNGQYFAHSYLDMNPLYRTALACKGGDQNPGIIEYMTSQEEFDPAFLLNASIGKSWYIDNSQLGFSLSLNNLTNNKGVRTGGYEQTRLISSANKDRYYRFDSKYFYMQGFNYMLNIYFRF